MTESRWRLSITCGRFVTLIFCIVGCGMLHGEEVAVSRTIHPESFRPNPSKDVTIYDESMEQNNLRFSREASKIVVADRSIKVALGGSRQIFIAANDTHRAAEMSAFVNRIYADAGSDSAFIRDADDQGACSSQIGYGERDGGIPVTNASTFDFVWHNEDASPFRGDERVGLINGCRRLPLNLKGKPFAFLELAGL